MVFPIGLNHAFPVCWTCGERHSAFTECKKTIDDDKKPSKDDVEKDLEAAYDRFFGL